MAHERQDIGRGAGRAVDGVVDALIASADQVLASTELALDEFAATLGLASQDPVEVPSPLLADVLRPTGGELAVRTAGRSPALAEAGRLGGGLLEAVAAELAMPGRLGAGSWLCRQRDVLVRTRQKNGALASELKHDLERACEVSSTRSGMQDDLVEATHRLTVEPLPDVSEIEARLYERWIDSHFRGFGSDAPGCIEFSYKAGHASAHLISCTIQTPRGAEIEARLNVLLNGHLVPRTPRPCAIRVRKRILVASQLAGSVPSTSCAWLDLDGRLAREAPPHGEALMLDQSAWQCVQRFVRPVTRQAAQLSIPPIDSSKARSLP